MIPVPGDYNGDGKSDMGLWNKSSDYRWYIKDAPDMQNNFSLQTINNSIYKWWIHAVVNGITSEAAQGDDFTCGVLPITASCSISPSSSDIGQMVTWTATSTGGLVGSLTYSWQGTGLAGKNTRIATTTYSTSGIYYATTTVSDGVSTSTVGCIGDVGETVCSGTCCSNNCACVGSCNPAGVCGGAAGEYDFSATEYRSGGPCSPPSTLSGSWSGYLPSPGATSTWQCLGANGGDSTTCYAYHSNKITDSNLNCSLSLTSPLNNPSSVNVNTNTQWTVSSVSSLDLSNSQYTKAWSSTGSGSVTGSNVWNKIFTTIGQKTVGVTVSTDNTTGVECTKNINVIQAGGGAREF
jgi:hypothetical protein